MEAKSGFVSRRIPFRPYEEAEHGRCVTSSDTVHVTSVKFCAYITI